MAARFTRIPKLTLFSGPNCSLCDIAKAELAKVRQQRPFELEIVNIRDKGQERWMKKYVYWIPALHLEGKEIAKGRWDQPATSGSESGLEMTIKTPESLYFVDSSPDPHAWYEAYVCGLYTRATDQALGEQSDEEEEEQVTASRCFNCGSPDHILASCPFRLDRELISLSRQYHDFYKESRSIRDHPRIHVAIGWRQQRLKWLEEFEPGQIRSPLLQEAILPGDGDWLKKITLWGYPPGWISVQDPRNSVRARIMDQFADEGYDDSDERFCVFNTKDDIEEISQATLLNAQAPREPEQDDNHVETYDSQPAQTPTRWAHYPSTYFSTEHLFVYSPSPAPPASSMEWHSLFDGEDYYSLSQLYDQPPPPPKEPPPPLPPSLPPPPLNESPPSLPSIPPPPLSQPLADVQIVSISSSTTNKNIKLKQFVDTMHEPVLQDSTEEDEADMDISDAE